MSLFSELKIRIKKDILEIMNEKGCCFIEEIYEKVGAETNSERAFVDNMLDELDREDEEIKGYYKNNDNLIYEGVNK